MKDNRKGKINEATSDSSGGRGSYNPPLRPGLRKWLGNSLDPFVEPVSNYINAENNYDSLDGKMSKNNKNVKKKESVSKKIRNKDWNIEVGEEGDDEFAKAPYKKVVQKVKKNKGVIDISEANTSVTAGLYNGPIELGLKKWKNETAPFNNEVSHSHNKKAKKSKMKDNVLRTVGVWEKGKDGSYHIPTHDAGGKKQKKKTESLEEWLDRNQNVLYEDLAVWFGTKKKPKGSKQPKGPWVNICRKDENGKHPPCGRPEATDKAYPKCRAAGVAGKMSDSEKRSACQQKRRAEKSNPKSGTGNKPKLVSYKPRNENTIKITESQLERLITVLTEQSNDYKWTPTTSDQKNELTTTSTYSSSNATKGVKQTYSCVPMLFDSAVEELLKKGYDKTLLKASLGVIGRESGFGSGKRYQMLSSLKSLSAYIGLDTSVGFGQIKPETVKKYGLTVSDLNSAIGSLIGVYNILKTNYNKAINVGYSPKEPSSNFTKGTGNAALDISIVSFNAGEDKIKKYCSTNNPNIKKPCLNTIIKTDNIPQTSTTFTKTTNVDNVVNNEYVKNYLPNFKTQRWDNVNITSHGYVAEVAGTIKNLNCF